MAKGFEDLKLSRLHSLIYGLVSTLAGLVLIGRGSVNPLFTLSGFMLVIIGMGLFFIGLVFTLPLASHASWHAYREALISD